MTAKEAKRLLMYTVVTWDGDEEDLGTVCVLGKDGFYVDWENNRRGWFDYRNAKRIEKR